MEGRITSFQGAVNLIDEYHKAEQENKDSDKVLP